MQKSRICNINMQKYVIFMSEIVAFLIIFSKFATNLNNKYYDYEHISKRIC